ncbi:MAG: ankyrin repeat domain-containing protein [Thiohalomonadales bacterium]
MKFIFYIGIFVSVLLLILSLWGFLSLLNSTPSRYAGDAQGKAIGVAIIGGIAILAIVIGLIVSWLGIRSGMGIIPRISLYIYISPIVISIIALVIKNFTDFQSDRHYELEQAVEYGDVDSASKLLQSGISPNIDGESDYTNSMLQIAAQNGDVAMMKVLVNAKIKNIGDALEFAVRSKNLEAVEYLLSSGVDANYVFRNTALSQASTLDIARALVKAGSNPQIVNKYNETILMSVVKNGVSDVVDYVLTLDTDFKALDNSGKNALHYASYKKDKILVSLLDKGVSCQVRDTNGQLPLYAIWSRNTWDEGLPDVSDINSWIGMKRLVKCSGGINIPGSMGETIIMKKSEVKFYPKIFDLLLELGADVNAVDEKGKSAIFKISLENTRSSSGIKTMHYLLSHGASVNLADLDGNTVLHRVVVENRTKKYINTLLSFNADPNQKNKAGLTPFINYLREGNTSKNIEEEILTKFIKQGVDLSILDNEGNTPIIIAITKIWPSSSSIEFYKLLIKTGKEKINNITNLKGETPLMLALNECRYEIAEQLIKNGVTIKTIDNQGNNVFHHMASCKSINTYQAKNFVEPFINAGVSLSLLNKEGQSPYDLSLKFKQRQDMLDIFKN